MTAAAPRSPRRVKPFTGRHMAAILVGGFGIVVAVNVTMASLASSTFGGVVVENSYVASQKFNTWLDQAAREKALGWKATTARRGDGRIEVRLAGAPASASLTALARHPLGRLPDTRLTFRNDNGSWISDRALPEGRWMLRLDAETQGRTWRAEEPVQ